MWKSGIFYRCFQWYSKSHGNGSVQVDVLCCRAQGDDQAVPQGQVDSVGTFVVFPPSADRVYGDEAAVG